MTKRCICFVSFILSLSILFHAATYFADSRLFSKKQALSFPPRKADDSTIPDNSTDRLFWFIQLSDLHLSRFNDQNRTPDFSRLCSEYIPVIAPDIVIVSGDITDAKYPHMIGSKQFQEEWMAYDKIVRESGVSKKTLWLDLRGNHDDFNVPSVLHPDNYFRQYSVSGENFTKSFMITHRKSFGNYSFIAMDACPSPGPKRPLNFFGVVTSDLSTSLESFASLAQGSNQTFWFGHYPTSTIVSRYIDLRKLIGKTAYSYLCGHLHELFRLVPHMYTVQPQGFLELELGDWRDGRFFRVMAVDNDLVSFVDTQLHANESEDWPLVLITNPKNSALLLPNKEPTNRILHSSHIRILVWSPYKITRVSVKVNGEYLGDAKSAATGSPLYVLPWQPSKLVERGPPEGQDGHTIQVACEDEHHNTRTVEQSFTLDGTTLWNFGGIQSFVLLTNHSTNLMVIFYLMWSLPLLALVLARIFGKTRLYVRICEDICQLEGLREAANSSVIFYGFLIYLIYLLCGPIFMGYLLEDTFGFVFTFGILAEGCFIPEPMTYLAEIMQQIIFIYPLFFLILHRMRRVRSSARCCFCHFASRRACELVIMWSLTILQCFFSAFQVLLPYGFIAFFLSPGRLWLVGLAWGAFVYAGCLAEGRRGQKNGESGTTETTLFIQPAT